MGAALCLRCEQEVPVNHRVVERLHPEPVTGAEEHPALGVPQREGEHAAEVDRHAVPHFW